MTYGESAGRVIHHSKMNLTTGRNFGVFDLGEFIGAIAEHIPGKGDQMVRYYGNTDNTSATHHVD